MTNPPKFWLGLILAIIGGWVVYLGADYANTNLVGLYNSPAIGFSVIILGFVGITTGLVVMLMGWLGSRR
ncbi:hypothetical protein HJC99_06215 [Candidatus Saccharibacteria bacterium]|nr:hypothetical protein [Candidatus Saccharibacteria bacterium]